MDAVKAMMGKVNKSTKLCQDLEKEAKLGLMNFPSTRWNYIYLTFERLLRIKSELEIVLRRNDKEKYLTDLNWSRIMDLKTLLGPFYEATSTASKVKAAVSSEVIPTIFNLQAHLRKLQSSPFLKPLCERLLKLLEFRFRRFVTDDDDEDFRGTFIASTLLDPRYRVILSVEQREIAKRYIINRFQQELQYSGQTVDADMEEGPVDPIQNLDILDGTQLFLHSYLKFYFAYSNCGYFQLQP